MEDLTFGEQVKVVLSRKGMTIKELAEIIEEKTGMKMSRQNLTQRLGRDNFQEQDMRMIASILDCPFQLSILGGESAELTPADLRTVEEMRRKEGKLEDGEPTLEEMQIELPLEELKPHEEEENQAYHRGDRKGYSDFFCDEAGRRRGCKTRRPVCGGYQSIYRS